MDDIKQLNSLSNLLAQTGEPLLHGDGFFRCLVDALPAAIYATDRTGRITYFNEAAAELWGCRPELGETEWCGSWKLFWPDGRALPHAECPMAVAVREQRSVRGKEAVAVRPDGSRVPIVPFPTPIYDASSMFIGAVNMVIDISDRKQAEAATLRLASIVESSDDAILSTNLNGIITSWNGGAERIFGYAAEEIVGESIRTLVPADRQTEEDEIVDRIRWGQRIEQYETKRLCKHKI